MCIYYKMNEILKKRKLKEIYNILCMYRYYVVYTTWYISDDRTLDWIFPKKNCLIGSTSGLKYDPWPYLPNNRRKTFVKQNHIMEIGLQQKNKRFFDDQKTGMFLHVFRSDINGTPFI